MAFWGDSLSAGSRDPKRKYRFRVLMETLGGGNVLWYAKTAGKPEITVSGDTEHKFLGHTFKFPGSVSWNSIEIVLVDPGEDGEGEDAAKKLLNIIEGSGYKFPRDTGILETVSKGKATDALSFVTIEQLAADGQTVVERWKLHNPFITKVAFNDLDYGSDDLSEVNVEVTYDWAEFSKGAADESQYFES